MLFLQLFYTFLKIGLFGFGGGYAMLSMIQGEVVTHHDWVSASEFTDIVAISQMTPGPIGINSATYVGYAAVVGSGLPHELGILGAFVCTFAVSLPSFLLMLTVSRMLIRHKDNPVVGRIFATLRPTIVGLIAAAALTLMTSENFGHPTTSPRQFVISLLLFIGAFTAVRRYKVSPILVLLLCGIVGGLAYA